MSRTDAVRVSTVVPLGPDEAFRVFTEEIDLWWRHGPRFRPGIDGRKGEMRLEPKVGGRLLEVYDASRDDAFPLGEVRVWEPGERLVLGMGGRDFAPGEFTEVEILFEPAPAGTRVRVEHRGFDALPDGHGAFHGGSRDAFTDVMGLWWGDVLFAVREWSTKHGDDR